MDLINHARDALAGLPTIRRRKEHTMRFERDELGLPITVDLKIQGRIRKLHGKTVIESKIRNTKETIGFGHDHPLDTKPGIGPKDLYAPAITGKPSFVRDRNGVIYLIENVDGQLSTIVVGR